MSDNEKLIHTLQAENEKLKEENRQLKDRVEKPLMFSSKEMASRCSEMYKA